MVKVFGLVFAALLVCAHLADMQGDAYLRPLSMFRDYEPAWMGYALFVVLMGIGFETIRMAFRTGAELHAIVYMVATGLLAVVAATPSIDSLHTTCALAAMALLFVYYAVLLYHGDSMFWFTMHLLAPSVLMKASQLESYGVWQKRMILYFLAAAVVHHHVLARRLPRCKPKTAKRVRIRIGRKRVA